MKKVGRSLGATGQVCRGDWIRTSDPQTPSLVRYQAALRPGRIESIELVTESEGVLDPHRVVNQHTG